MRFREISVALALAAASIGAAAAQPVVQVRSETTQQPAPHPMAVVSDFGLPAGARVLSGGARANWTGAGSLLFESRWSFSDGRTQWVAQSKDHLVSDPATVTSYMLYIVDPQQLYQVQPFFSQPSAASNFPTARASVPAGWVLTGGGCSVDWRSAGPSAPGSLLTGSYPEVNANNTADTWICSAREHGAANPATITAVAMGIRPNPNAAAPPRMPVMCVATAVSAVAAHPMAQAGNCAAASGGQITGGGAMAGRQLVWWRRPQLQLLSATYPWIVNGAVQGWEARSKDHVYSSPGNVTAYAISVVF
ncbi:MAG: hypothetical protein K2P58_00950 [Hyphomonadaceae bacterium]|nr:hypothetical protein [Hyphomonadaceae bacterium]